MPGKRKLSYGSDEESEGLGKENEGADDFSSVWSLGDSIALALGPDGLDVYIDLSTSKVELQCTVMPSEAMGRAGHDPNPNSDTLYRQFCADLQKTMSEIHGNLPIYNDQDTKAYEQAILHGVMSSQLFYPADQHECVKECVKELFKKMKAKAKPKKNPVAFFNQVPRRGSMDYVKSRCQSEGGKSSPDEIMQQKWLMLMR